MVHYVLLSIAVIFLLASLVVEWYKIQLAHRFGSRIPPFQMVRSCEAFSRLFCWIGVALMFLAVAIFI